MKKTVEQISPVRKSVMADELVVVKQPADPLKIFDERTVDFFERLSRAILNSSALNRLAEMAALGFWLRKANIQQFIKENVHLSHGENGNVSPVGTVFHVCPSNVDTMFLYSLAVSLLMGNHNLVRVSRRQSSP